MDPPQIDSERRALRQTSYDGVKQHDCESMYNNLFQVAKEMDNKTLLVEWEDERYGYLCLNEHT